MNHVHGKVGGMVPISKLHNSEWEENSTPHPSHLTPLQGTSSIGFHKRESRG